MHIQSIICTHECMCTWDILVYSCIDVSEHTISIVNTPKHQTDRQRQIERQTDRQTERQTDRETDSETVYPFEDVPLCTLES